MAKVKSNTTSTKLEKSKVSRPGVHAKTKTSKNKGAQNYQKPYAKQGR